MSNFYYLATVLPTLKIGEQPDITFAEFDQMLRENLSVEDYKQVREYRRYFDIHNLRALAKNEEFDPHGNFSKSELEEEIVQQETVPDFFKKFLEKYPEQKDRVDHYPDLLAAYFRDESKEAGGLLTKYLDFERKLRLVMVGFRAKKLGRNILKELQYEDPEEELIGQILAQKDAPEFEPPEGFENLRAIFEQYQDKPLDLHQALVQYRFEKVEEFMGLKTFNLDYVLGYLIQLVMVEKWLQLDKQKGTEIVDKIVKGTT